MLMVIQTQQLKKGNTHKITNNINNNDNKNKLDFLSFEK